jgi:hypothetical protein
MPLSKILPLLNDAPEIYKCIQSFKGSKMYCYMYDYTGI